MLLPTPESSTSSLIGNLVRFVLALVVMVVVLYFVVAYELYAFEKTLSQVQANSSFNTADCEARRIRAQNLQTYYLRRSQVEQNAAKRGYTTTPEWTALAQLDNTYLQIFPYDFFKGCGTPPSPPPDLHFVTPAPPELSAVPSP